MAPPVDRCCHGAVTLTADDVRALALSSPWLWTSLHLTHRDHAREVEAWLQRPDLVRVRRPGRPDLVERRDTVGSTAVLVRATTDGEEPWTPPARRRAAEIEPERRPDGLVRARPEGWDIDYDELFHENYRWVAMLDPAELAVGVEMTDVRVEERQGRETWSAQVRAVEGYDPRCSCCPLLWSEVSDLLEAESMSFKYGTPQGPWPEAYDVALDRTTGVVVSVRPVGGEATYAWFEVSILDVT